MGTEGCPIADGRMGIYVSKTRFTMEGITIMIAGAIRNEFTRGFSNRLSNLEKCAEIRLLGETQLADDFFTSALYGFF